MSFWLMVFTFCFAVAGLGMYFDYRKHRLMMMDKINEIQDGVLLKDMQRELAAVKQRLAVLEKIITDKRYDLNEELAALRSKH